MSIHRMMPEEEKRVVQLVNKTNQFNVTTKRYSEEELKKIEADFAARLPKYAKYEITTEKEPIQKFEGKIPPFIALN